MVDFTAAKKQADFITAGNLYSYCNYSVFNLIQIYHFSFKTLEEASQVAATIPNFFPNNKKMNLELGLNEIFFNAIEHGNLNISFEEKCELRKTNRWLLEIEKRLNNPLYKKKEVQVVLEINPSFVSIEVEDEGDGFNWDYCDLQPPANLPSGRGLYMAKNISFDAVEFIGKGNKIRCYVYTLPMSIIATQNATIREEIQFFRF